VVVHGAIEQAKGYAQVLDHLDDLDVVTYDRRGHGERWGEGPTSLAVDAAELLDIIGAVPSTVVGHSIGGLIAMAAYAQRPGRILSLGLYETAVPWADWWTEDDRAALLAETDRNASAALLESKERARMDVAWASCRREVLDAFAGPFRWQDVDAPLVVGQGATSTQPSARDAALVAESLGAERVVLAGAGHRAHRTHPAAYAAFIRDCVRAGIPSWPRSRAADSDERGERPIMDITTTM